MIDQQSTNLLNILEYGLKRGHGSNFDADKVDGIEGAEIRAKQDYLSAGIIVKPTITVLTDGSVAVGDGEYVLYSDTDFSFPLTKHKVKGQVFEPGTAPETLIDNSVNYIFVSRSEGPNGEIGIGTPRLHCSTDRAVITQSSTVPVATLYKNGTDIHWLDWDEMAKGLSNKLTDRCVRTDRFRPETGGLLLGYASPQYVTISAGKVWYGANAISLAAVNSQTDDAYVWYHTSNVYETHSFTVLTGASATGTIYVGGKAISVTSGNSAAAVHTAIINAYAADPIWTVTSTGTATVLFTAKTYGDKNFTISFGGTTTGVTISAATVAQGSATGSWTRTLVHTFDAVHYDDSTTGLQLLNNNYYGVNWVFREINSTDHHHIHILLDGNNNQLIGAQTAKLPVLPPFLAAHAVLVGRIIVRQGFVAPVQVDSAFDIFMGMSATVNHNDLTSIQGGTTTERYHLTATEYNNYVNGTLQADTIQFDTNLPSVPPPHEGLLYFEPDDRTLNYYRDSSSGVSMNIGEEMQTRGYNDTASMILNGTPVRLTGTITGGIPTIAPADAAFFSTAAVIGVATQDIPINTVGYITTAGVIRGLNTSTLTAHQEVYLAVGGGITSTIPVYPNSVIKLGHCLYSDLTAGKLLISLTSARTTSASFNELRANTIVAQTSIGVNTATPSVPLEVVGNIKASDVFLTDNNTYLGNLANDLKHNGIPEAEKSKWSTTYDAINRQCTLTITGSDSYYFVDGKRFDLTVGSRTFPAHANTAGIYYFSLSNAGVLTTSPTAWSISDTAQVAYVIYNPTNDGGGPAGILHYEFHGMVMSPATHRYLHSSHGTQFISGGAVSGYTLTTDTVAAVSWALSEAMIEDEDIYLTTPAQPESNYYVGYFDASNVFHWRLSASLPFLTNGTDILYNQLGTGLTPVTGNNYACNYYILLTNAYDGAKRILVIPGQQQYTSVASAQSENVSSLNLSYLPVQEFIVLYQITYVRANGYSATTGHAAQASHPVKLGLNRITITSGTSAGTTDHNLLTNRNATGSHYATAIATTTTNFNGILSAADIDVQLALDTIDDNAIDKRIVDAAGDLIIGSAADTVTRLPAGTNNYTLIADSSIANAGLKWGVLQVAGGGTGAITFTSNAILTGNGASAIQTPGPTLSSTTLTFAGSGTLATTGNLTLSPSTKTTTALPIEITNTTDSSSTSTGALIVSGGAGIAKNLYVGANAVVTGDLTVNGTTVTINSSVVSVDDKNIELGAVATPTDTTADGGGIILKGTSDKTILWDDANDNWTSNQSWNLSSGLSYKINNVSVLSATTLGSNVINSSLTSVGTITSGTWSGTTIAVNKGGTGATSVTQGGVVYGASATAYGSSAAGSTGQVLLSGGTGSPTWTSGTMSIASGKSATFTTSLTVNTGNITISGNASGSTLILPTGFAANYVVYASATNTLASEAQLAVSRGGTGIGSYAVGDLLYASGTTTLAKLADVAAGSALISGGVATAPGWGKIGLTTHVSGILPVANGGTGSSTTFTQGSVIFAGASGTYSQDNANFFWDDTNDRLGIKTTTPETSLHLVGPRLTNGSGSYLIKAVDSSTAGIGVGGGIAFSGKYSAAGAISDFGIIDAIKENSTDADYAGALRFHTRANGNVFFERMRITSAGLMGIGTSTPGGIIHALHSEYTSTPLFERSGQTTDTLWIAERLLATKTTDMADGFGSGLAFFIQDNAAVHNVLAQIGAVRAGADNTGDLIFNTSTVGTPSEKMRITSGGRVAIGSTSTQYGFVEIRTSASNTGGLSLWRGTGSTARHWIDSNDTYIINRAATDTLGIAIKATGEVGFGTVSPAYVIDAVGSIRASSQLISSVATGTAPLAITSTTLVSNLNSDYLDGQHGSYYLDMGNMNAGTLPVTRGGTGTATQFTAGSVVFAGTNGVYTQDNSNFFWDDANNRLGLGTAVPATRLHTLGDIRIDDSSANAGFKLSYNNTSQTLDFIWAGA